MRYAIVVVGGQTGAHPELGTLLARLPATFPLPLVVVSHPGAETDPSGAALPAITVEDKEPIRPGRIHLAPPDYHLLVDDGRFALSTDAPVHDARPSIDVLFASAADAYGDRAIGVLVGASGPDGRAGLAAIADRGGTIFAPARHAVAEVARFLGELGRER